MCTTPTKPASTGTCRWICRWAPPTEKFPGGKTGVLSITSYTKRGPVTATYMVEAVMDHGRIVGWELTNLTNDEVYHLDPEWGAGQWTCTCGDHVFRCRECKQARALQAALKVL